MSIPNQNAHFLRILSRILAIKDELFSDQWNLIYYSTLIVLASVFIFSIVLKPFSPDQFIYLAKNFSQGKLSVDDMPLIYPDYVIWEGHAYLPPGPFPAVILIPFLPLIDLGLRPGWISFIFTLLNVIIFWILLKELGQKSEDIKWLSMLYFGGTVYFGVAVTMISWYFAHVIATTLILLAILVATKYKKPLLVGLLVGLASTTRLSLVFALPFFSWILWTNFPKSRDGSSIQSRLEYILKAVLGSSLPIAVALQ